MLRNFIISLICISISNFTVGQDSTAKSNFKFKTSINATLDRSIVERFILISNNSFVFESKYMRFEPIINYRYGTIKPNGRDKQNLENDLFIQLENLFLPHKKYFPSVIGGFENSPNFRQLNQRYLIGGGINTYPLKKPNKIVHINLLGIYEHSNFESLNYNVFRLMHMAKGKLGFNNDTFGISFSTSVAVAPNDFNNYRMRTFLKPYFRISKFAELNLMYDSWQENIVNGNSPKEISTITLGLSITNFK